MKTRSFCAALSVLVLVAAPAMGQPSDSPPVAFAARIAAYAAMHPEIEQQIFARVPLSDLDAGLAAVARFGEAIRAARHQARVIAGDAQHPVLR